MGDRANIHCKGEDGDVWFYTHWRGLDGTKAAVAAALGKARDRWTDTPYLNRVIFQELLAGDTGTTGFGISASKGDDNNPDVIVDYKKQEVRIEKKVWSFTEFFMQKPH